VICDAMRAHLDPRSPIARDVTIPSSQWGNRLLPIHDPATNVTNDDPLVTGKIALAHLNEFPDYYTRLEKMEAEAEREHGGG